MINIVMVDMRDRLINNQLHLAPKQRFEDWNQSILDLANIRYNSGTN